MNFAMSPIDRTIPIDSVRRRSVFRFPSSGNCHSASGQKRPTYSFSRSIGPTPRRQPNVILPADLCYINSQNTFPKKRICYICVSSELSPVIDDIDAWPAVTWLVVSVHVDALNSSAEAARDHVLIRLLPR